VLCSAPGSEPVLGYSGGVRIVLERDGKAEAILELVTQVDAGERDVHGGARPSVPLVDQRRNPDPERRHVVADQLFDRSLDLSEKGVLARSVSWALGPAEHDALAIEKAGGQLRPTKIECDDLLIAQSSSPGCPRVTRGYHNPPGSAYDRPAPTSMPGSQDKPYKVYRGGRVKGPVKPLSQEREKARDGDGYAGTYEKPEKKKPGRMRRRWRRVVLLLLLGLIVLALVWALLGYLAVRRGVSAANERLPEAARRALAPAEGSILTNPTNMLVLGADVGGRKDRKGPGRSDSIMLVRTDPDQGRISYVAIPRDLYVPIPGHGEDKINAAFSLGGPALAIDTVEALTGLGVNHVVIVDFESFREVVDAVGGITVQNPKPILSAHKFDCPLRGPEQCARWKGWSFRKGEIHLDGRRALVYSRIRQNKLDPAESDITRAERQQRVVQGVADEVVGLSGFVRMPLIGDDVVKPLATDLSTGELLQLGWVRWRAADDKTLRCRLGGDATTAGGAFILRSSEDNRRVMESIVDPDAAPLRPRKGDVFAPGCFTGRAGG
jgi:LCP family protein required for cell wall assembly